MKELLSIEVNSARKARMISKLRNGAIYETFIDDNCRKRYMVFYNAIGR